MVWLSLLLAGILEIVWAFFMKQSAGFTKPIPSILTVVFMIGSFLLLSYSMKSIPLGTAYMVWTGIGAVGTFLIGILILGETTTPLRMVAAFLIVSGLVLMKLSSEA